MRINKKLLAIASPILIFTFLISFIIFDAARDLGILYTDADHVIDIHNPREVIGFADNVFVALIEEEVNTVYRNSIETSNGKKIGDPYTQYRITVISNLKGKLKKNTSIILEQSGGVSMNGEFIELLEGAELLKVGEYYIIAAGGEPDGRIVITGPTSSIKLDYSSKSEIISSNEYKDYKKYVLEEVKFERSRFKSKYEEQ